MGGDKIVHATGANWQAEVLDSSIPVLVDFWAEWCGPCRAMNPVIEALSEELSGKIKFVKVDVDQNHDLAGQFGIRSIPTLLVLKAGKVQEQMVGSQNKVSLQSKLSAYMA